MDQRVRCPVTLDLGLWFMQPGQGAFLHGQIGLDVAQMCSRTFALLHTESCYVECPLQAFDCKGHQLETLNIILRAQMEAHD